MKKKLVNKGKVRTIVGDAYKEVPLSPEEEAVANLMKFKEQINQSGKVGRFGEEVESLVEEP